MILHLIKSFIQFLSLIIIFSNCYPKIVITLTQTPTASEKQMLGEGKFIEKDGWIISSIRTSVTGADIWEKEVLEPAIPDKDLDDETYIALRRIAYLSGELREYKKKGFIGESLDGTVKINPKLKDMKEREEFPKFKERIDAALKLVNDSRQIVLQKKITLVSKENLKEAELQNRKRELLLKYYSIVEEGDFFEVSNNNWIRKE
ncbi:MAG: DUF1318 domain-containing protein [Leptospiraceae bacterium]|nr:DUF1318 domain-containing protein [Leptospiraceae bacterium]